MKITLLLVGKNKEAYVHEALNEYKKRIRKYLPFTIEELPGIKASGKYSNQEVRKREGEQLLKALPTDSILILLDERGKQYTSREFAHWLQKEMNSSTRSLIIVIGGAYGFSQSVYEKASGMISLSKMTFSHQISRIVFAEQLYRAFTIIKGEPYHHEG